MKSIINKNIAAALVLAAAGLSGAAQGATSAEVRIKATVVKKLDIKVDPQIVDFGNLTDTVVTKDVKITTSNNTAANIIISSPTANSDTNIFDIQNGEHKHPITTKINGADESVKFDGNSNGLMSYPLKKLMDTNDTILNLSAAALDPTKNLQAGEYDGYLTIKIAAN